MIKNVMFDCGGVLVVRGKLNTFKLTISRLILKEEKVNENLINPKIKTLWNLWRTDQISENEFFQKIKKILNINYPIFFIKKQLYTAYKPEKEIFNLVNKLKQNYKLFLLSNNAKAWYNSQNKKLKLEKLFDGILTSFQAKISKPNIKIYKLLLEKFKLSPKECLFIDDQEENLLPAKTLGMITIHYKNPDQLIKELKKHGIV